jgi:protocatechuate 3,4-dioxygenase beta subunit
MWLTRSTNISRKLQTTGSGFGNRSMTVALQMPQSIEGPLIISISDLSACRGPEGRPSLGVDFRVIDGATCARVDIWHADAPRFYSDYKRQIDNEDLSTVGQAFLRRTQFTYCEGRGQFPWRVIFESMVVSAD